MTTAPPTASPPCAVCGAPLNAADIKLTWCDGKEYAVHQHWRDCFKQLTGLEWEATRYGLRATTERRAEP